MRPSQHHFSITGFEAADALFVSALQCSQAPTTDQVPAVTRNTISAPVIDHHHNIAEHMAYTEEKGSHSSQKFPRKPEFPR
jgi:hypothetical protein